MQNAPSKNLPTCHREMAVSLRCTESNFNLHIYTHLVPIVPYNKVFNLIHVQSDERENQIESYQQMTGKKKRYLI